MTDPEDDGGGGASVPGLGRHGRWSSERAAITGGGRSPDVRAQLRSGGQTELYSVPAEHHGSAKVSAREHYSWATHNKLPATLVLRL